MINTSPTHIVHDLTGINPHTFIVDNPWLRAISYDRDGTVTDFHSPVIPDEHLAVLDSFAKLGIMQGFNSNSGSKESAERVANVATAISEVIDTEFFVATSYEAGGIKPGPKTFNLFSDKTGVSASQTLHVGDQWYKDVLGARRAGLRGAMLVAKYGEGDDWRVKYLQRPTIELAARLAMNLPLSQRNFPAVATVV
jgi:predicted HAD superfamily phosphohydrolase YqeG